MALVDLIVGDMEFDTSKVEKLENTRSGGYMLTTENEGYDSAKEERLRKENTLVHIEGYTHCSIKLKNSYENTTIKSRKNQRNKKGRREHWQGSVHKQKQEEATIVMKWSLSMDQQRKGDSRFSREKTQERKSIEGGVRKELIRWKDW